MSEEQSIMFGNADTDSSVGFYLMINNESFHNNYSKNSKPYKSINEALKKLREIRKKMGKENIKLIAYSIFEVKEIT